MITRPGFLASLLAAKSAGPRAATAALLGSACMAQEGQHGQETAMGTKDTPGEGWLP